jgi:addiction module HigA family antidote
MAMPTTSKSPITTKFPTLTAMGKSPTPLRFPHPGEILQMEFLEPMGVTQYRLAMDLKIPHSRVTAIIRGRRAITPDTALRLSRYFGTSAEFWIGLQQEYDLRKARAECGKDIESQISPLAV